MRDPFKPWLRCAADAGYWCSQYSDRIPGSVINQRSVSAALRAHPETGGCEEEAWKPNPWMRCGPLFSPSTGGFILSPTVGPALINCAYRVDAGTIGADKNCVESGHPSPPCVAGCSRDGSEPPWCTESTDEGAWDREMLWGICPFPASQLERMMSLQLERNHGSYNEISFNPDAWERHLPQTSTAHTVIGPILALGLRPTLRPLRRCPGSAAARLALVPVEAVFFLPTSSEEDEDRARQTHRLFLNEYGRSAEETPLLLMDLRNTSASGPFTDISYTQPMWAASSRGISAPAYLSDLG